MSPAERTSVAVGCGSGFALDKLGPAVDLAKSGRVEYLSFDALAERTLALAQTRKLADITTGHDPRIAAAVEALGGEVAGGLKVVGNFGGANVPRALQMTVDGFRALDLHGVKVAAIEGDDVLDLITELDVYLPELEATIGDLGDRVVSANCYLGAAPVVEALEAGASWVIGGRISDPSLFAAPICHAMGWDLDDFERVAHATLAGHILECSVQATGGYFADPPYRDVPDLHALGFPIAEVSESEMLITKLPGTGGVVNEYTVGLQVAYEVHDPAAYLTPDVVADFSAVTCTEVGPDEVRVSGAHAHGRPEQLKVLVGVAMGYRAVGEISYAAAGCVERARLAAKTVEATIDYLRPDLEEIRYDLVGVNALAGTGSPDGDPAEVRLRVAARCESEDVAEALTQEVERLYVHGPAGGGGVTRSVVPAISVFAAYVDASDVHTAIEVVET